MNYLEIFGTLIKFSTVTLLAIQQVIIITHTFTQSGNNLSAVIDPIHLRVPSPISICKLTAYATGGWNNRKLRIKSGQLH